MQEKLNSGIGWLHKLLDLQNRFGFFSVLKGLFILLLSGYTVFFALNPKYLLDKLEREQTERHDEAARQRLEADGEIRLILHRLMYSLGADRAWLVELHNGNKNLSSGLPFLYGDMRMEETKPGTGNVDEEYTDFSLSKYPFVTRVLDEGFYRGNTEEMRETDQRLYHKLMSNDVNELAVLTLYSGEKPLGVLGLSFCGNNLITDDTVAEKVLRKCGVQIATLLSPK